MVRAAIGGLFACVLVTLPAHAGETDLVLLPTRVISDAEEPGRVRRGESELDERLTAAAQEVDQILAETAQDLGLTLDVSQRPRPSTTPRGDQELVARAIESWVVRPELTWSRGAFELRIVAVAPGSRVTLAREERVSADEIELRAMHMFGELVAVGRGAVPAAPAPKAAESPGTLVTRANSPGRAVLALNSVALGGFVGFSLQRASGSEDTQLTYPLVALGAGIGLGGSMIVADEWDIGVGDAWFLSAGMGWTGAGAFLLATGYGVDDPGDPYQKRYLFGVLGATGGAVFATTALAFGHVSEGGAAMTHSGGLLGTFLGAFTEASIAGSTTELPELGMGYGAIGGTLVTGLIATQVDVTPSRVLLVDLLGALGGLTGAAVASPLVVRDEVSEAEQRGWLASVAAGTALGVVVGAVGTRPKPAAAGGPAPRWSAIPYSGPIAAGFGPGVPAPFGLGVQGVW